MRSSRALLPSLLLLLLAGACVDSGKPAEAPVAPQPSAAPVASEAPFGPTPPPGTVPSMRIGSVAPIEDATVLECELVGRHADAEMETLALHPKGLEGTDWAWRDVVVSIDEEAGGHAFSFAAIHRPGSESFGTPDPKRYPIIWVRRAAASAGTPLTGDLFFRFLAAGRPGRHVRFHSDVHARPSSPDDLAEFYASFAELLRPSSWGPTDAFRIFASARLDALAKALPVKHVSLVKPGDPKHPVRATAPGRVDRRAVDAGELAGLMETTTGALAVQESIQRDRKLFVDAARSKPTVPIASIAGPSLGNHPWRDMLGKLGAVPEEPLAKSAPADFYYIRARDLPSLFQVMDTMDDWGTPASHLAEASSGESDVAARYLAQLGLARTELARTFGPSVIHEVAVVGSDPYAREGTDVTVLFHAVSASLVSGALDSVLAGLEAAHGPIAHASRSHAGVSVAVALSADGVVRQERATVGELLLVSNSPHALDAVIDAGAGARPRLSDELDFKYMLARDADTHADLFGFMGDRCVAEVTGPKQKILEARRAIALGELVTPGYASLLHGWLYGRSPRSVEELVKKRLIAKDELTHAAGGAITWAPGAAARSSWGTPASMTPLIDLPPAVLVTPAEEAGYKRFAQGYQGTWSRYVDPIAVRVSTVKGAAGGGDLLSIDLRQLPLLERGEYHELLDDVGDARFAVTPLHGGLRWSVAIGRDAKIRNELTDGFHSFAAHELKFDWLGEWAAIGIEDRPELASVLLRTLPKEVPQAPLRADDDQDEGVWRALFEVMRLPVYAEVAVSSATEATIALAAVRTMVASDSLGTKIEWEEVAHHREVPIVRIRATGEAAKDFVGKDEALPVLYYALCKGAIIVSLQDWVLRARIDDRLDGKDIEALPTKDASGKRTEGPQAVLEVEAAKDQGLFRTIAWTTEYALLHGAERRELGRYAEDLLRGAPEVASDPAKLHALGLSVFGMMPVPPDGGSYTLAKDGLTDPHRGSDVAPTWPNVPVEGSPLDRVLRALSGVRNELSFDREGKTSDGRQMLSLHVRVLLKAN